MADVSLRGRFVWHELTTSQPDAAAEFYGKLVGWKAIGWEHDPNYRIFDYQGAPRAGLMRPSEGMTDAPPHWLTYIGVPDVDATVRQAVSRGATTYQEPMDVPTVGRLAVLADPQGAVFAVFRPLPEGVPPDDTPPADFSWHELATTDWRAAWDFYRGLFGWERDSEMEMSPGETYFMFKRAGGARAMGGIYHKPAEVPVANWLPYILVPNAERAVDLAKRNKATLMTGPMEVPGGDRIAVLMDPIGAAIAVHSRAPARPAKAAPKPRPKTARKAAPKKTARKKKPTAKKPAKKRVVKKKATKKAAKRKRR
jgi:predicted enzyme related to lactoylglutathione lyase